MKSRIVFLCLFLSALTLLAACKSDSSSGSGDDSDTTAPKAGTAISFADTSVSSTTVSWGAASDNETSRSKLQYRLVMTSSSAAIDTVKEAKAVSGSGLVMNWKANVTTKAVSGLATGTTYWFAVLAKDEAGNVSLYAPKSVATTADTTAPTIGDVVGSSGTSGTATTLSWGAASDDVTAQASLSYKVVQASSSGDIDTVGEADAITTTASGLVMAWTANATSYAVTGLTVSTTYWFAVLVKDEAGNVSLYVPVSVTTSATADTTAPSVDTDVYFLSTTSSGTTVNWGAATDNVTASTSLEYKLVQASASTSIDTVSKASAATVTMDWTANTTSYAVTGLTDGTTYYFAVLVKDAAGNTSLYNPKSVTTVDVTAPTAGTKISFTSTSSTGTTVSWGAATDNLTETTSLSYKVVQASSSGAIDTLDEANGTGCTTAMAWTANATSYAVTGLTASTTYWFAVLVKDAAGNTSLYAPASVTSSASSSATLVAEYHFENNGNASTGSYKLTASGSPTYSSSTKKEGSYSVYLSGSSYLYNSSTSIDVSSGMTVSAWIDFSTDTNYNSIVTLYNGSGYYYCLSFANSLNPMTELTLYDNSVNPACTTSLASGKWYHVVFTVDTSKNVVMYVDGSVIADNDSGSSNVVATYIPTITKVEVGTSAGLYDWDGYIDDVRIYSGVLSASEVSALYSSY